MAARPLSPVAVLDRSRSGRRVALVTGIAGLAICGEALASPGLDGLPGAGPGALSTVSVLGLGLIFGLKHALEADHVAAVSIIVSERRSLRSASLVGALWGLGHTASLLVAGVLVILLHVEISARVALGLELGVALMLIALGLNALRTMRRTGWHMHAHQHGGRQHLHPHVHAGGAQPASSDGHHRIGLRPLLVGMVHGMAGSAALMLLLLSTIPSPWVGFAYIGVFGLGSIGGMLGVSLLLSLPVHFAALRLGPAHTAIRVLAALFSLGFGLSMAYQISVVDRLLS